MCASPPISDLANYCYTSATEIRAQNIMYSVQYIEKRIKKERGGREKDRQRVKKRDGLAQGKESGQGPLSGGG
jgi:hypothetical protein